MAKNNSPKTRKDTSSKARKAKKIKTTKRKSSTVKPRNHGTQTESMFWTMIRSSLRSKSRFWKPILEAKRAAKRIYNGINKRQRFEYLCSRCQLCFPEKKISVHHKIPCGTLSCAEDLAGFVERLFCEIDGLEVLCDKCHDSKHGR